MTDRIIRVELIEEINRRGIWHYRVEEYAVEGRSRQPLLDACRAVKRMGGDPRLRIGLFRNGSTEADLSCILQVGAGLTVDEYWTRFKKWEPHPRASPEIA